MRLRDFGVFRRVGIRNRVGALGTLGVIGVVLVGVLDLTGHLQARVLQQEADGAILLDSRLSRVLADLAQARVAEIEFAAKMEENLASRHDLALGRVQATLGALAAEPGLDNQQRNGLRALTLALSGYGERSEAAMNAQRRLGPPEGDGLRGRARASAHAIEAALSSLVPEELVEATWRTRNRQQRFARVSDQANADALIAEVTALRQVLARVRDQVADVQFEASLEAFADYLSSYAEVGMIASNAILRSSSAFADALATGTAGRALAEHLAELKRAEVAAARERTETWTRLAIIAVAFAVAVLAACIGRSIARPLTRLAYVTQLLSVGNLDVRVGYRSRRDEIGDLARALSAFRDTLLANEVASGRIYRLAHYDALTGLANRVLLQDRLAGAIADRRATGGTVAVHCLDLDGFKAINDLHGHRVGDDLLREVAVRLGGNLRNHDLAVRLGGDEFVILQPDAACAADAQLFAHRLAEVIAEPCQLSEDVQISVTTSIGIALFPHDGTDADSLLRNADTALYRAKWAGKNAALLFQPEMDRDLREQRALEADLQNALERGEFALVWQPIASAADITRIGGYEVLLRWHHPVRGPVSPDVFIPIAEASGAISAIGEWVLRAACAAAATWAEPRWIAVNASALQVQQGEAFASVVEAALAESGLAPTRLTIEVTESVLIREAARVLAALRRIKDLGVRIALDDFGTGYSSLATLRCFPFDKLKVDRSFIAGMVSNEQDAAIIKAVVGLAEGLGLPIVAEGVEEQSQLEQLAAAGCDEVQGWLIGRPAPLEQLPVSQPSVAPKALARRDRRDDPARVSDPAPEAYPAMA